jgi:hypothetical protein
MIGEDMILLLMQKVWDKVKEDDGPGEPVTLKEFNRRAKKLKLKPNPPQ